jgi:SAM-dependent methyltransferase
MHLAALVKEGRLGLTQDNGYYASLPDLTERRVLEVGCSMGLLAQHIVDHLKPREYRGLDSWQPPEMTPALAGRWQCGDLLRRATLPLDERWDVVICFDVLYHLLSPLDGLRNLYDLAGDMLVLGTAIVPEGKVRPPAGDIAPHHVEGAVLRFAPNFRGDDTNFFFPTEHCLVEMLRWAGFQRMERKYYFQVSRLRGFCDRVCYHCWKQ